jgi:cyclic pyranopterin phosphate synthase
MAQKSIYRYSKMMIDTCGRAITYLRISVTDRCNFRCTYCMPPEGIVSKPHFEILSLEQMAQVAIAAGRLGVNKIKLTGGEPLVRKNLEYLIGHISWSGFYSDIGLTTNGALLTKEKAVTLRYAGLQRVNISLDTLNKDKFSTITRGGNIDDVLNGINAALEAGFSSVKINMIIFDDTNPGEIAGMKDFCRSRGLILQTIRQFTLFKRVGALEYAGDEDRPPKCTSCNRLRLTADGFLKSCLFSDEEVRVDFTDIEGSILNAVHDKPFSGQSCTTRTMSQIGG